MAEFARAWAYANNLQVRVTPGMISEPGNLRQIKQHTNGYGDFRSLSMWSGFMPGTEFVRIAHIDTEEKSELLRLYTTADANPDVYFKILFFWHTIVYPSKKDWDAVKYINEKFDLLIGEDTQKETIFDGTFGEIEDGDIGKYIYERIRHAIGHIQRHTGISLIVDDVKQRQHLYAVPEY